MASDRPVKTGGDKKPLGGATGRTTNAKRHVTIGTLIVRGTGSVISSRGRVHGTGTTPTGEAPAGRLKLVSQSVGPYNVVVAVDQDGRFLRVIGVEERKDFMTMEQRIESGFSYPIEDIYRDDED
jgi:hypothetical protein